MANINTRMQAEAMLRSAKVQNNVALHSKRIAIAESVRAKQGREALSLETKAALATCLENTRQLCEATQSSNIPSKTFFLDMVASVVPNIIAPELVSVQAMDAKAGMISYLKFVYGTDKGATARGQMFNNSLYKGDFDDMNYSSSLIENEPLADTGDINLAFYPVVPGTLTIEGVGTDDGKGVIGTGTIDYKTGKVTGVTVEADATATYAYDNETAPVKVPQINLELAQIPVFAKSRKLAAYWGFDAAFDLKKQYGEDVTALMATQAAGEIAHEIDTEIIMDLYNQAGAGAELVWSKTAPVGVQLIDHYDTFWAKLAEGDAAIFGATQRFNPNFICCGINVAAVIQVMRNFSGDASAAGVGPHFIGTVGGRYKVYVVPAMPADAFVMGFKGNNFLETGYVYAPYMPVTSTDALMLANMTGQQGYATSYGKKMVNSKLYIKGRIAD